MSVPFPPTIDFSLIKPKGYSAQIVNREFTPAPFNANIAQQDLIRFVINQHRGFWDPYSAYIDCDCDFSLMSTTGVQQIDGSAHSLVQRLQIYVNGTSLELIDDYDSLMHLLHDMQMSKQNKKIKISEGVGQDEGGNDTGSQSWGSQAITTQGFVPIGLTGVNNTQSVAVQKPSQWLLDVTCSGVTPKLNLFDNNLAITNAANIGAIPLILSSIEPLLWNTVIPTFFAIDNAANAQHIPLQRYENQITQNNFTYSPVNLTSVVNKQYQGNVLSGIFSGNFCNQNFEDTYSINYPQYHVKDGNMGVQSIISTGSFQFPLASSLLGILMPSDSYKYLPFSALPDLVLEFTLNKYAFFTSGYIEDVNSNPITGYADLGCRKIPVNQQLRSWQILKFNLNVDIIIFDDPSIEDMINAQLITNGILLHSCGWTLALKQVLQTTAQAAGNFQINYGFESLKALFITYELNDYQLYSFARKHFRCSRNVTSLQLRIGDKIYPQTPIIGHGGNALKYNQNVRTNQQFVNELYKAFGKQFTINSESTVNMANFAINKRPYNVSPLVPMGAYFTGAAWVQNYDVQVTMGQSLLFENQVRGMAIYAVALDVLGADNNVMGGVDTKQNIPFNVLVTTDTTNTGNFPSNAIIDLAGENPVTAQFWCYYDYLVLFKAGQTPQKIGAQ